MKNNYPIRYALMPIYVQSGWWHGLNELERCYDVDAYIVSKCYVISEIKTYNINGKVKMNYQVVFPYQMDDGDWRRKEPEYSFYDKVTNSVKVEKIYDSYDEAFRDACLLNEDILGKRIGSIPYDDNRKYNIDEVRLRYEDNLEEYRALEQEINLATIDLELDFKLREQEIIEVSGGKARVRDFSLYDYIRLMFGKNFCAFTLDEKEYELMKSQISENGILENECRVDRCLLVSDVCDSSIRIIDCKSSDEVLGLSLRESIRSGEVDMVYDDKFQNFAWETEDFIRSFDIKIYTTETYEDLVRSYLPYYKGSSLLKENEGNINLINVITPKMLKLRRQNKE